MAGAPHWHGSVKMKDEELVQALGELGGDDAEISWALGREASHVGH
jgi:hypothetical protein